MSFQAATGEANQVEFTESGLTFRDPKSTIKAGTGCTAKNPHEVSCTRPADLTRVEIDLLDGDDRVTLNTTALPSDVRGDAGDDEIVGGAARDEVLAGSGSDRVMLGAGDDRLFASDQSEALAPDVYDGGEGNDEVDYGTHSAGVTINLADPAAPSGEAGEGDSLTAFENAFGSGRDDVIVGSAAGNVINAWTGNDRVEGGDGGDQIRGHDGNDRIYGGNGRDVATVDAGKDRVSKYIARVKALPPATSC
ncbi:MAG: hypothetical protein M3340_10780 [Actinomycetota bacterium]|nr:hypothetical protein [Actinomycetota bacterium]